MKPVTLARLKAMKRRGEKIVCLTAYDASFASLLEAQGVEVLLVGDSLGMVVQGEESTLPVTVADMIYHTRCVKRGARRAMVVADMPFMSYATPPQALGNAVRLMKEGGAHMVKMEGPPLEVVEYLNRHRIPLCAHLGLQPQSVHKLGGYRVQGREDPEGLLDQARALEAAGADLLVLECVPRTLAARIAQALTVPVIGIGAGPDCDGQVLVLYDMLGITRVGARFVRRFLDKEIPEAIGTYVEAVKGGLFPGEEHSFD